jgi:hypothetical protein
LINFPPHFPSKYPSIASAETSNTPYQVSGFLEDNQCGRRHLVSKKSMHKISSGFLRSEFFCFGVSYYFTTTLSATLSPVHFDITRFHIWSPIATRNHLDRPEKLPNVAQTTGTADVLDPRSGIW